MVVMVVTAMLVGCDGGERVLVPFQPPVVPNSLFLSSQEPFTPTPRTQHRPVVDINRDEIARVDNHLYTWRKECEIIRREEAL